MTPRGLPVSGPTRVHASYLHCVLQLAATLEGGGGVTVFKTSLTGATKVLKEQRGMEVFRAPGSVGVPTVSTLISQEVPSVSVLGAQCN